MAEATQAADTAANDHWNAGVQPKEGTLQAAHVDVRIVIRFF